MVVASVEGPQLRSSPPRARTSLLTRVLGWLVLALFLAAIGAALLAGLTAFLIFFVLLIPVLLLLLVVALTGRGTFSIRVQGTAREPDTKPGAGVAQIKQDR